MSTLWGRAAQSVDQMFSLYHVQFIFYLWSFEISGNILRNQKNIKGLDSYIPNRFV